MSSIVKSSSAHGAVGYALSLLVVPRYPEVSFHLLFQVFSVFVWTKEVNKTNESNGSKSKRVSGSPYFVSVLGVPNIHKSNTIVADLEKKIHDFYESFSNQKIQ